MSKKQKQKEFEIIDIGLDICPFCHQEAQFGFLLKQQHHVLRHHPTGICPARIEAFCEDKEFALRLWQWKEKNRIINPESGCPVSDNDVPPCLVEEPMKDPCPCGTQRCYPNIVMHIRNIIKMMRN